MPQLALYLICHHGAPHEAAMDARVIQRLSEKRMPVTYFFSGIELNTLLHERGRLQHELWFDPVSALQSDLFINPRYGHNDPHQPEMGIMPFHHVPLVLPWHQHAWQDYFDLVLRSDIHASTSLAQYGFGKAPVTIHPPDGVYAPAAAHALRECGLDTVVVSSEFLIDNHGAKGGVYHASGLRHLMRTNDIQPQSFGDARSFMDAVEEYSYRHWLPTVTVGCDIDEFNGMRMHSGARNAHDGIAHLCCIADEAYRRGIPMVNCNAAAYTSPRQRSIDEIWPWNDVHAMIHDDGNIGWIDPHRNGLVGYTTELAARRMKEGWNPDIALGSLRMASDIALRNSYFCHDGWLTGYFHENIGRARHLLQG